MSARTPATWINIQPACSEQHELSSGCWQLLPISRNFKPRVLLDLARLQGDLGYVKAGIFPGLNGNQFGGIKPPGHRPQGARQRLLDCIFFCPRKTFSGAGVVNRHEVPTLLANHGFEDRRGDLFDTRPVFTQLLRKWVQRRGESALAAQENGVRLHDFALLGASGTSGWKDPGR